MKQMPLIDTGLTELFGPAEHPAGQQKALGQYFTPDWAAEALLELYYPRLGGGDVVLEPSCGTGAFLKAIPGAAGAIGVEIDPALAEVARERSGRLVIVGDFLSVDLPSVPTHVIGNPPFKSQLVADFLDRAWHLLPNEGECGFILPAFVMQTPSAVERMAERWEIRQDMLPRNLFPRLSRPCCFMRFTKGPRRGLIGFALYHEARAVQLLENRYRKMLSHSNGSVWEAVTRLAMLRLGGTAKLGQIYDEIQGKRPTTNPFWKEKVRQTLQRIGSRVGPGVWSVEEPELKAA